MTSTPSSASPSTLAPVIEDLEWEEWDSSTSPLSFFHHCLAGSFAGLMEHTLLYPLDTVKTCWQSQVLSKAVAAHENNRNFPYDHKITSSSSCRNSAGTAARASNMASLGICSPSSCGIAQTMGQFVSKTNIINKSNHIVDDSITALATLSSPNSHHSHCHSPSTSSIWTTMKQLMQPGHPWNHGIHQSTNTAIASSSSLSSSTVSAHKWSHLPSTPAHSPSISSSAFSNVLRSSTTMTIQNESATHKHNMCSKSNTGVQRLFRGVQTMLVGCIPAHALYFSSYEIIKQVSLEYNHKKVSSHHHHHTTLTPLQAMLAGGVATFLHDLIMTPMDTMKQRMQLGHYCNLRDAFRSIVWGSGSTIGSTSDSMIKVVHSQNASTHWTTTMMQQPPTSFNGEGWKGLYRSFPITVLSNIPYGMIMVTTNEWLRGNIEDGLYGRNQDHSLDRPFHFATILFSGMGAGTVAAAVTAPLDRVKTRLQTQRMGMVLPNPTTTTAANTAGNAEYMAIVEERALAAAMGQTKTCPKMMVENVQQTFFPSSSSSTVGGNVTTGPIHHPPTSIPVSSPFTRTYYSTPLEAFQSIVQEEGPRGLFRGAVPRVALHAPSVAISWTAYELMKGWLLYVVEST